MICLLQLRELSYPVFHVYDVIAFNLSTVKGAVTRYLVGRYRLLSLILVAERKDSKIVTLGHDAV